MGRYEPIHKKDYRTEFEGEDEFQTGHKINVFFWKKSRHQELLYSVTLELLYFDKY